MRAPVVLLDACVLVPHNLMSILLTCAEHGLIEIRWSERILTEVQRTLVKDLDLSSAAAERRIQAMRDAFPEAAVEGYERFEGAMHCHRKDRHVLAAAVAAEADVLVTFDLGDFPENGLPAHDLVVQHPEQLLGGVRRDSLAEVIDHESRRRLHAPKLFSEILAALAPGMPTLANVLHQWALDGRPTASEVPGIVPPVEGSSRSTDLTIPTFGSRITLSWAGGPRCWMTIKSSFVRSRVNLETLATTGARRESLTTCRSRPRSGSQWTLPKTSPS